MELEYDYWTGSINEVKESLIRSVSQYIRHYRKVKIGITNNPERRKIQHQNGTMSWNKMTVKYKTTSLNYIKQLEKILVDYHWDYIKNKVGGGGGIHGEGPYYLYILIK